MRYPASSFLAAVAPFLLLPLLSSVVGAFLSTTSSHCDTFPSRSITDASSSCSHSSSFQLSAAFIDEGYPHAPKGTNENSNSNNEASSPLPPSTTSAARKRRRPPTVLPNGGSIALVGAGPGSPDLLTVAAHRIISDPNSLVIVDRLVSNEIVDLVQGECRVANKHPGCQHKAQAEIYGWCKEGLEDGRKVVRLKIGDPFVFGRGGEEVLEFREFGVEPTVIPGVSAAFSAPLLGSIPVTHRGVSNQVVMCTGYGRENTSPSLIRYHAEQTVVFLMAVGRLRALSENLVNKAGYPPETPVGIVERAGCPEQRTVRGTLETIADVAEEYDVRPPSTIVVGEVVNVLETEEDFGREVREASRQGSVLSAAE